VRSTQTETASTSRPSCGSWSSLRRFLDPLVLQQPPHQLGARVFLERLGSRWPRQQQARLDLDQHRGHHQVLGGELQVGSAHRLDVLEVLARQRRHGDVEDVEIFPADQVQQQVERPLERLEDHFQRIRRDVKVLRDLDERLAVEPGDPRGERQLRGLAHQE
jgi:hypothetical protein